MEELSFVLNRAIPGASQLDYILLVGGASHDVTISPTIPKDSIEKGSNLLMEAKRDMLRMGVSHLWTIPRI